MTFEGTTYTVSGLVYRSDKQKPYVEVSRLRDDECIFMQIPAILVELDSPTEHTTLPPHPEGDFKTADAVYWAVSNLKDWLLVSGASVINTDRPVLAPRQLCNSTKATRQMFGRLINYGLTCKKLSLYEPGPRCY